MYLTEVGLYSWMMLVLRFWVIKIYMFAQRIIRFDMETWYTSSLMISYWIINRLCYLTYLYIKFCLRWGENPLFGYKTKIYSLCIYIYKKVKYINMMHVYRKYRSEQLKISIKLIKDHFKHFTKGNIIASIWSVWMSLQILWLFIYEIYSY